MANPALRRYLREAEKHAEWIVSVCTGALILASLGLLEGREVTTHWAYRSFLPPFGARYARKRWTHSGKIINSAGVSAGIDMALHLAAQMAGEETARQAQLLIQYDPHPPFGGIDYDRLGLMPRLMRGANGLRSYIYTKEPRRMIHRGV